MSEPGPEVMARFVGAENAEPGHEYLGQLDTELSAGRRSGVLGMAERGTSTGTRTRGSPRA